MNASDKRNGEEITNEIKNAITTNAHFNKQGFSTAKNHKTNQDKGRKKPVCLILDEIDGALGGGSDQSKGMNFVSDFLKKCIRVHEQGKQVKKGLDDYEMNDEQENSDGDKDDKEDQPEWKNRAMLRTKREQAMFPPLSRPIILVCNDGYAKALYPLKDIVLKLRIEGASSKSIDDRLIQILRAEGLRDMSNSVRKHVIEQSNGDARSAITRIQMIASNRDLTHITSAQGGQDSVKALTAQGNLASLQEKDLTQSIF